MIKFKSCIFLLSIFFLSFSLNAMDEEDVQKTEQTTKPSVQKVLDGVSETLLIPLYGRALETARVDGVIDDPKSVEIIDKIKLEYPSLRLVCSPQLQLGLSIRTQILDERVTEFLRVTPNGNIINLGAGLCTRFFRIDNGQCSWSALDLPQVENLWRHIYQESDRYKFIQGSVVEIDWFGKMLKKPDTKTLFIAEGLLMYFSEENVNAILSNLVKGFPGAEMLLDVVGIPEFLTNVSDWIFPDLHGVKFSWGANKDTLLEKRRDLSITGSWPFLERHKERWDQTTKTTRLYSMPGMGVGPRVIHLKFDD